MKHINDESIRKMRENTERDGSVMRPFVEFWRDDHLVVAAHAVQQDIGQAIAAIHLLVPILAPTHIYVVADVNFGNSLTNPATGEEWAPGEMTQVKNSGTASAAAVSDGMMLILASRTQLSGRLLPYGVADGECFWHQERTMIDGWENAGGRVITEIGHAFQQPCVREEMVAGGPVFGLTQQEAEVHTDAVAIKTLLSTGEHNVVIGFKGDPDWDHYLEESLHGGPTVEQIAEMRREMTESPLLQHFEDGSQGSTDPRMN